MSDVDCTFRGLRTLDFYMGTHIPGWLSKQDVPALFISHRRLVGRRSLPAATGRWALDSGGFSELSMFGEWRTTPSEYVAAVARYVDEIGNLDWAAPQDWMCEPWIVAKTAKTVIEHQRLTLDNYLTLRTLDASLPIVPVLQGWDADDYHRHLDAYVGAVEDFTDLPTVGIGSVCRRQSTNEIADICAGLSAKGVNLHGFGVKTSGLRQFGTSLVSADSLAWSFGGRKIRPCPQRDVKSCANCYHHALEWRRNLLDYTPRPQQMVLI